MDVLTFRGFKVFSRLSNYYLRSNCEGKNRMFFFQGGVGRVPVPQLYIPADFLLAGGPPAPAPHHLLPDGGLLRAGQLDHAQEPQLLLGPAVVRRQDGGGRHSGDPRIRLLLPCHKW